MTPRIAAWFAAAVVSAPLLVRAQTVPTAVHVPAASGPARVGAMGAAAPLPAHVPIVLSHALPIVDTATGALYSAMLAIGRAQQINPNAAQTASFQYFHAVQQYESGNIAGARRSALEALSTAGQAQVEPIAPAALPAPALVPAPAQLPGLAGGLYGADAPAIDADAFLALARGVIDDCAARHDRRLAAARQQLAAAERDFAARDWQATRGTAKAAIDACAKAQPPSP